MTPEDVATSVHALAQRFQEEGVDGEVASNTLLAYALAISNDTRGREETARHLYLLAVSIRHDLDAAAAAAMVEKEALRAATH